MAEDTKSKALSESVSQGQENSPAAHAEKLPAEETPPTTQVEKPISLKTLVEYPAANEMSSAVQVKGPPAAAEEISLTDQHPVEDPGKSETTPGAQPPVDDLGKSETTPRAQPPVEDPGKSETTPRAQPPVEDPGKSETTPRAQPPVEESSLTAQVEAEHEEISLTANAQQSTLPVHAEETLVEEAEKETTTSLVKKTPDEEILPTASAPAEEPTAEKTSPVAFGEEPPAPADIPAEEIIPAEKPPAKENWEISQAEKETLRTALVEKNLDKEIVPLAHSPAVLRKEPTPEADASPAAMFGKPPPAKRICSVELSRDRISPTAHTN